MTIARYQAVIFDMDGLMLDTESMIRRCLQTAAAELGFGISDALYTGMIGGSSQYVAELLRKEFGADFPLEELRAQTRRQFQNSIDSGGIAKKAGLDELIDFLDQRMIARAVGTSTRRADAEQRLRVTGLLERFEAIVCGDEVAAGKPAPDIFLAAAGALGAEPARCLVLEDSGPGVRAARAAGMTPLLVPDLAAPPAEIRALAHGVFASLHEVLDYFSERLGA